MLGKCGPQKAILTFAVLGSMLGSTVVGLPVVPTEDVKNKVDEPEQIVYTVRCHAGTYVIAHHCQAHCNGRGYVLFNDAMPCWIR
ncbi:hypothetical protein FOXYSP1_02462 [Fusarium oxysporum f. sp. phaseoli]